MCNIAGYIGSRRAAPILIDMLRRQEGFAGGYYTGIATLHEGKIHYAKVVGSLDRLLSETDACNLPGTVGIIHSRSYSPGNTEWSHPFLSNDGRMAMVINGHQGMLCPKDLSDSVARSLAADGFRFRSRLPEPIGNHPTLPDGSCVHFSEAMALLTERYGQNGKSPEQALAAAFCELPAEMVTLTLFADEPDAIVTVRRSQPMMIGRTADATYLATTAIAFPEEEKYLGIEPVPVASSGIIRRGERAFRSLPPAKMPVGEITSTMMAEVREQLLSELKKQNGQPATVWQLLPGINDRFPEGTLPQKTMLVYETLRPLLRDGTIRLVESRVPGVTEELEAPVTLLCAAGEI